MSGAIKAADLPLELLQAYPSVAELGRPTIVKLHKQYYQLEPSGQKKLLEKCRLGDGFIWQKSQSQGVARITIANRTLNRAVSLGDEIRLIISDVLAISTDGSDLLKAASSADIIVNSTSMGMRHSEAEGQSLLHSEEIPASAVVYDMVYNPSETPLISEARQAGAMVVGGLSMLIHQGAAAFLKWTGKDAPIAIMMEAGEKALSQIASN